MAFENITDTEWAYFAGIIDGEGCISIHAQRNNRRVKKETVYHTLFLSVGNTSHSLLKWLSDKFGGSFFPQPKLENRKQVWHWNVAAAHAEELLRHALPYLVVKTDQAELVLRFRDSYKGITTGMGKPLPVDIKEFREKCKLELNAIKKNQILPDVEVA